MTGKCQIGCHFEIPRKSSEERLVMKPLRKRHKSSRNDVVLSQKNHSAQVRLNSSTELTFGSLWISLFFNTRKIPLKNDKVMF